MASDDDLVFPIVMTTAGYQPQTPDELHTQLIAAVNAVDTGYTANLPGALIEDISSTDVYALLQCDSSVAEIINSCTPYGANAFLLIQLGNIYGVMLGEATNTSVYVVFTGPVGYVIAQGFTVSDGTYQYILPDGGVIGAGGVSLPLYAVATISGSWAVPFGTVTQIITSVPNSISASLSVNNPLPGLPATVAESEQSYRTRVLQAGLAESQGMARYLKTLLQNIPGVQPRLVSVRQVTETNQWEILCGGGDPYQVAYAIYFALFDINNIVGSTIEVSGITNANPGVVTTNLNHGLETGNIAIIIDATGMVGINEIPLTVTVITEKTFSIDLNTTSLGAYTGNGILTPNNRNVTVSLLDFPDTYEVTFVNPPLQTVEISVLWNTDATNLVSGAAVAQLVIAALINYVNNIVVGQPINQFVLDTTFQVAVANILPAQLLTRLVWTVSINDVSTPPEAGTGIIAGDPESYFYIDSTMINVAQG